MAREEYTEVEGGLVKRGGFATVRPVKRRLDGKILACKCISFDRNNYGTQTNFKQRVEREIRLLKCLDHPNIVQYYDMHWGSEDDEVKIYTEYLQDQNLDYYVSQNYTKPNWPSEREAWSLLCQLSAALAYCHHGLICTQGVRAATMQKEESWHSIWHRDIKPENVLVQYNSSGQAVFKICDFGLGVVRSPEDTDQLSFGGTYQYIAPEVTKEVPDWSNKADIFALGCTFFYCYGRVSPWRYQLTNASSATVPSLPEYAPKSIKDLTSSCIAYIAQNRPEADKLFRDALEHIDEKDRTLATRKISYTTSEYSLQDRIGQSSGQLGSVATQTGRSSLEPHQKLERRLAASRLHNDPSYLAAGIPVQGPPFSMPGPRDAAPIPRQSADPFYSLQNNQTRSKTAQIPIAPTVPSSSERPTFELEGLSPSFSAQVPRLKESATGAIPKPGFTNSESEDGILGEVTEMIGALVIDYKRHPPMDVFRRDTMLPKKLRQHDFGSNLKFRSQYASTDQPLKRSRFNFLAKARDGVSTNVSVAIEADRCVEYMLDDSEGYIDMYSAMANSEWARDWIVKKKEQQKSVYVVVAYIVYLNARVQETAAGEDTLGRRGMSLASHTGIPEPGAANAALGARPGISANSMGSNTFDKEFEKRDWQIQAISVRQVFLDANLHCKWSLGEEESAYFWGPRNRPY